MGRKKRRNQRRPGTGGRPPSHAGASVVSVLPDPGRPPPGGAGRAGPAAGGGAPDGQLEVLVGLVATGALDDCLGALQAAISQRQRVRHDDAARHAAARLRVGDRVRISAAIRPQYLRGATGTVTGWSGRSAVVHLDAPVGRFATSELRCPPLGLQVLHE